MFEVTDNDGFVLNSDEVLDFLIKIEKTLKREDFLHSALKVQGHHSALEALVHEGVIDRTVSVIVTAINIAFKFEHVLIVTEELTAIMAFFS